MNFINKIYENEYFVYILLGVIAILTILFIVVAVKAKKEKNKKAEITPQKAQEILRDIIHVKADDEYDSKFFLINCLCTLEKMKVHLF